MTKEGERGTVAEYEDLWAETTRNSKAFFRSREIREFASGALAGAMSKAVLAPLETIRY